MQCTLIILTKTPIAGQCKTRLQPKLGARGAARLQAQLIRQRVNLAVRSKLNTELHVAGDLRHPSCLAARRLGLKLCRQTKGDLGSRMRTAQAHRPSIIIGTDCPALGLSELMSAQHCIQEQQAVCIPANDGGYVLLGLPYSAPVLYQQIHWGSSRVLRQTRRQARRSQLSWHEQASLPDLDTPADYWREKRLGRL